eukprot:TRINITY_DN17506_c0_g1_i1.p1 TRINITY_DN17506_c0_g1~~TRINITY_DN17506_c0_g1_i1.p1  ORF type:complete len:292 (+),score=36.63 TRINITY_DN17506_c0_g1_i1:709-1584(+)
MSLHADLIPTNSSMKRYYIGKDLGNWTETYNQVFSVHGAVALTSGTHAQGHFCDMVSSAMRYNVPLHILNYGGKPGQNVDKLRVMQDEVRKYAADTIIVHVDAFDSVFNNEFDILVKKFRDMNKELLFSVEYKCWPNSIIRMVTNVTKSRKADCYRAYKVKNSTNTCYPGKGPSHINSGLYMGYVRELERFLTYAWDSVIKKHRYSGDQMTFHEVFLLKKFNVSADYCVDLFMNMLAIDEKCKTCPLYNKQEKRIYHTPSKQAPPLVHFQGSSKYDLFPKLTSREMFQTLS